MEREFEISSGYRENDRVVIINNIRPKTVEEAVGIIKEAGKNIEVVVERKAGSGKRLEPPRHFTFNQNQYNAHRNNSIIIIIIMIIFIIQARE